MSEREEVNIASCDLKALKDFVAEQKDVILVVGKEACPVCEKLDAEVMSKFNQENQQEIGVGEVTLKLDDAECIKIRDDLGVQFTPTLIAFKGGVEIQRSNVADSSEENLKLLREMAQKITE